MAQQLPTPQPRPRSRRKLTVAAIAVALLLTAAVPAAVALTLTPWQRSASSEGQWLGLDKAGDALLPLRGAQGASVVYYATPAPSFSTVTQSSALDEVTLTRGDKGAPGTPTRSPAPLPAPTGDLDIADRQIIVQANIFLEVTGVQAASTQVQAIAQAAGGYVEQLSASGGDPQKQYASITLRLPQSEFSSVMDRLRALGKVTSEDQGSQDVSDQFIDLDARLRTLQQKEQSLLNLLNKATQISDLLSIERELQQVRADIERYQGQLNFLKRRVDLATIRVTLNPPEAKVSQAPSGSLTVEVKQATATADSVKALVARLGGEIDGLTISMSNGRTRADVVFRVFAKDFSQAMSSLEGEGKVLSKNVQEGTPAGIDTTPAEKPDASIRASLAEPAPNSGWKQALIIGLWVGSGAMVVIVGLLFYGVYRLGKRRGLAIGEKTTL